MLIVFHSYRLCYSLVAAALFIVLIHAPEGRADSARGRLHTGSRVDVPSVNGKFYLFKDLVTKPLSPVTVHDMTQRRGDQVRRYKAYSFNELWIYDQQAGMWESDLATISVYNMCLPAGAGETGRKKYVSRSDYGNWKRRVMAEKPAWNDEKILAWLQCLTSRPFKKTGKILRTGIPFGSFVKQYFPETDVPMQDFYFVIKDPYTPATLSLFHYYLSDACDREKSERLVFSSLASIQFYHPALNSNTSKERVVRNAAGENIEHSPEYIANRDAIIQSIKNLKSWWYLETDNFLMVANIRNRTTTRALAENLERSRSVFFKYYPVTAPLQAVSVARMFQDRAEYTTYVGEAHKWSGGIWVPSKRELVVSPMDWGSTSDRRRMMVETTYHEAFHQYIFFATGEKDTSPWFNEGNAQFFEGLKFSAGRFSIGITDDEKRKIPLLTNIRDIEKIIHTTHNQFYGAGERTQNYAMAWGLMFFLQKGAPLLKNGNTYHDIPARYYEEVKKGNAEQANKIVWRDVDMKKFSEDFNMFWNNRSLISRAIRYDPLAH